MDSFTKAYLKIMGLIKEECGCKDGAVNCAPKDGVECGNPECGTPDCGDPKCGDPECGAPDCGTPDCNNPECGAPECGDGKKKSCK